MNKIHRGLLAIAVVMSAGIFSASAQIYVSIRPSRPVFVRTAAPGPDYVWIEEDWDGVGDRYEWHGGYWAAPPQRGYRYSKGYWSHSNRGNHWNPGRWSGGGHNAPRGNSHYSGRSRSYQGNNGNHKSKGGNRGYNDHRKGKGGGGHKGHKK